MKNRLGRQSGDVIRAALRVAAGLSLAGAVGGCSMIPGLSQNRPQHLAPSSFYGPSPAPSDAAAAGSPALGPDVSNGPSVSLQPDGTRGVLPGPAAAPTPTPGSSSHVSEIVKQQVKLDRPVNADSSVASSGRPASTVPVGASTGHYVIVGGVIAEVNGQPLYANKVLSLIEKPLKANAKTLAPQQFQSLAMDLIDKQVRELVRDELEFAAADRYLEDSDRNLATSLTMKWRDDQIVSAGGSIELARKRSAADDQDFDEQVKQQYRTELVQIYYQKKVFPKIQVSAEDIRHYYAQNLDRVFTQHDQARFRVIQISVSASGSRELALKRAWAIHDRAVAGEDFALVASKDNDNPLWKAHKGLVLGENEMMQRGNFVLEKVDQAVWLTGEGHITDVIDNGNAFYVAKVEKLDRGTVKPFETDLVQEQIRTELRSAQFRALREQVQEHLEKGAIIRLTPETMNIALDMAMQKYVAWSAQ
jgi:hypothetical protein